MVATVETNAQRVLDKVLSAGALGDLVIQEESSLSLKAHDGELEEHKVTSTRVYGVRVVKDDRAGIAYSESADPGALDSMVEQALVNATFSRVDPAESVATGDTTLVTHDAILCPDDPTTVEAKIDAALYLERELTARDKVRNVPYNGVQDATVERHVFATTGRTAHSRNRVCSAFAYALLSDGDKDALEGVQSHTRRFDDIDTAWIVDETYRRCVAMLDGEALPSRHYDILFDIEHQADLFAVFHDMFSAKTARDGINPLRDKVGERIAVDALTIRDAPLNADGLGYALFDDEGLPATTTTLVDDGTLRTLVHNSATATHFDVPNTRNANRSPRASLGVGLHQLEVAPGDANEDALASGEYLEIVDLAGLHSGGNPVSGDFSFGAAGFLCRDGERIRPVRNITVAGNFYEMLNRIAAIGDTQHWNPERSALMARIRFADVAISG